MSTNGWPHDLLGRRASDTDDILPPHNLTDAIRAVPRENPRLQGVIDTIDFNATAAGQRILGDQQLRALIQVLSQHRLCGSRSCRYP